MGEGEYRDRYSRAVGALKGAVLLKHRKAQEELYARADLENYVRRLEKEADRKADRKLEEAMLEIIPVVDELEIYGEAVRSSGAERPLVEGLDMVMSKLMRALSRAGLQQLNPLGEAFDPNLHSIAATERADEGMEGRVLRVVRKGYMFKGKVLRPALVSVGVSGSSRGGSGSER